MLLYLLLCLTSVLTGCGILTALGVDVDRRNSLFLAPFVTVCSLTIFMGGLVAGGFSVGEISPAAYLLCIGAAVLGAIRHGQAVLASWRGLLILVALPLLILLPSLTRGIENYSGGLCLDGWSYVTVGQALQRYTLASDGWFPVNVQYSAALGRAMRFISCAFLALLAPLSGKHNDTQEILGHYLGWLFFVYGSACLFFAKATRLNRSMTWILVLLATLSGWMLKVVNANSVDNALALCFFPALVGILIFMPAPSIRYGILVGAIVAGLLYAYPESSPFFFTAILTMGAQKVIAARNQLREFGRMTIALFITAGLGILPYAPEIASYFKRATALARGVNGDRPGEPFYQLLLAHGSVLPGYWGLIPDFGGRPVETYFDHYDVYAAMAAWILTLAALFGTFLLLRRGRWALPLYVAGMTAGYAVALEYLRYPYAAYKLLVLTWVFIVYLVIVTTQWIWERARERSSKWIRYTSACMGVALLAAIVAGFFLQEKNFYDALPFKSVREFKKVSVVENLARGSAVAMTVNETYANIWALHFLRNTKLYLAGQYRGYMIGYTAVEDRSEPVTPQEIRFAVTDNPRSMEASRLLSKIGPYYVWDCRQSPWVLVTGVDNPNGLEGTPANPFIWMGKGDTELRILSPIAQTAAINARFTLGPGLPGKTQQRLRVTAASFEEYLAVGNAQESFSVPLQAGLNHVLFRPLEKPTTFLPNDPRPLLIHAAGLSVSIPLQNETAQIEEIVNPNGLESWLGKEPFFWVGGRDTIVNISASAAGIARLKAILLPGPSLVDTSRARFSVISQLGNRLEQNLNWGPTTIDVPVQAGLNTIFLRAAGPNSPTLVTPHDPRIMMMGFRNLKASYLEGNSKTE